MLIAAANAENEPQRNPLSERDEARREFNHRVKNVFASVQALIRLTQANSSDTHSFVSALEGRIFTLSRLHDVLFAGDFEFADFATLLKAVLLPYGADQEPRISLEGPDLHLKVAPAQALAFTFHELLDNALKHGALSTADGRVRVSWELHSGPVPAKLLIDWREEGGPASTPAGAAGYGSSFIKSAIADALRGSIEMHADPGGLHARFIIPAERVIAA